MLGLVLALALTQTPQHRLFQQPNLPRQQQSYAFFEFAPASGAGMGTACACTTPTGAKGEALTFTRASSGTCLKGNTLTGIANGDMVTCSSNQPRVMPGGDGTGGLGLLVEGARTNTAIRSQEFNNASWVKANAGASAAPTVTADQAVAPDGNTTADQIAFPAVSSGGDVSIVRQPFTGTAAAWSATVFLKRASGSSTVYLFMYDDAGTTWYTTACTVTTSWSRCAVENKTLTAAGWEFAIGVDLRAGAVSSGQAAQGAQTIFAVGYQGEAGAFATSYIATAGATATRAIENVFTSSISLTALGAQGSAAVTLVPIADGAANLAGTGLLMNTAGRPIYFVSTMRIWDGATEAAASSGTVTAGTALRVWSTWAGSSMTVQVVGGASDSKTFDGTMDTTGPLQVCTGNISTPSGYVCKQACIDPDLSRCR